MNKLGQKALCLKLKSCVPPCGGGLELFMSRMVGTVSRGVRAPIIRSGDDLVEIVTKSVLEAAAQPEDGFAIRDRDVVAMTEAIVARAQGNYASVDDIAADVKEKLEKAGLHVFTIQQLQQRAEKIVGVPDPIRYKDRIVGVVMYRDNTIIDVVRQIDEDE